MTDVILLERIESLGPMGQVVKVKPGYARNYLLPQKKALRATKANLELFEKQRAEHEARNAANRSKAEAAARDLEGMTVTLIRQASDMGQLYGSVSARDVSEAAHEAGKTINRAQINIDTPIKTLGLFPVKVRLHADVALTITVNVARSPEEAHIQAEKSKPAPEAAPAAETDGETPVATDETEAPKKKTRKAKAEPAAEGEEAPAEAEAEAKPKTKKPRAKKAAAE
jgi:large subunit ribosomal protein L9